MEISYTEHGSLCQSSQYPTVNAALMSAYSGMLEEQGFYVEPKISPKSIKKLGPLEWEVTALNTYSFFSKSQTSPFLSGSFETKVRVTCHNDGEIDCVEGNEIYLPETIELHQKSEKFDKLVSNFGEPEGPVFFELINTLKFEEYGVQMKIKTENGIEFFSWGDYFSTFPVNIEDLHRIG